MVSDSHSDNAEDDGNISSPEDREAISSNSEIPEASDPCNPGARSKAENSESTFEELEDVERSAPSASSGGTYEDLLNEFVTTTLAEEEYLRHRHRSSSSGRKEDGED